MLSFMITLEFDIDFIGVSQNQINPREISEIVVLNERADSEAKDL